VASRASLAQLLWLYTQQFKAAHMHRRIALEVSFLPGAMRGKVRKLVVCPWCAFHMVDLSCTPRTPKSHHLGLVHERATCA
jgi:hypothetical protein